MNILSLYLSNAAPPEVEVTATLTRVVVGNSTTLTCTVTRSNPMGYTYKWVHNNSMIPGETSSILTVSILTESNLGIYRCEVTNSVGLSGSNTTTIELGGEYWQQSYYHQLTNVQCFKEYDHTIYSRACFISSTSDYIYRASTDLY